MSRNYAAFIVAVTLVANTTSALGVEGRVPRDMGRVPRQERVALLRGTASPAPSIRTAKPAVEQREQLASGGLTAKTTEEASVSIAARPFAGSGGAADREARNRPSDGRVVNIVNMADETVSQNMLADAKTNTLFRYANARRKLETGKSLVAPKSLVPRTVNMAGGWYQYLFDGFEGTFPGYWMLFGAPTWGRTSYRRATGSYSIWCAASHYVPGGSYVNNMNAWIVDGPFDLRNATAAEVYFDYWLSSEANYDTLFVGVSTDGENFEGSSYSGYSAGWRLNNKLIVDQLAGCASVYIAVQFQSDNVVCNYEGAYVDNIELDAYVAEPERTDLAVTNPVVLDALLEVFEFTVANGGPASLASNRYAVDVYVDDVLDSSARNASGLPAGSSVVWEWQLAYQYTPGPHTIRVKAVPDGGDLAPANNEAAFVMQVKPPSPADLQIGNVQIVNALLGEFDIDVSNLGPGTVLQNSYVISAYVDTVSDSSARNTYALLPGDTVTWQWTLANYYPPGTHTVVVDVQADNPDANWTNNTVAFNLVIPPGTVVTDLRVQNPVVTDPQNDIFTFEIRNNGPQACKPDDYTIRISVDGVLDSTGRNSQALYPGSEALWNWQLAYLYPPGLHVITIEVIVNGADPKPGDNTASFNHVRPGPVLAIRPEPVVTGVVDAAMGVALQASGGAQPCTWRVAGGVLPRGTHLSGDGVLAGMPREPGAFNAVIEARDAADALAYANVAVLVLASAPASPVILTRTAPTAIAGSTYAARLGATGGVPALVWTALDALPPGLLLGADGAVSGVATDSGLYSFRVRVRDGIGAETEDVVSLVVRPAAQYLDGAISKCLVTIPWNKHDLGNQDSDRMKITATFTMPSSLVIDRHTRLVVQLGDVPISLDHPASAKLNALAVFKADQRGVLRGTATLRRRGTTLTLTMNVSKAALADGLAIYGVVRHGSPSAIVPCRIQINDFDAGPRALLLNYRLQGENGVLKK